MIEGSQQETLFNLDFVLVGIRGSIHLIPHSMVPPNALVRPRVGRVSSSSQYAHMQYN